jgi:hypothetical protein
VPVVSAVLCDTVIVRLNPSVTSTWWVDVTWPSWSATVVYASAMSFAPAA